MARFSYIQNSELSRGLETLTFSENFDAFVVEVELTAGQELAIKNRIQKTPKYRLILRQDATGEITDGTTEWDSNNVYLKNNGSNTVRLTVAFFGG